MVHITTKLQTKLPQLEMKVGGRVQFVPTLTQKRGSKSTHGIGFKATFSLVASFLVASFSIFGLMLRTPLSCIVK